MNVIQLSPHVYKCGFSINISVEIPVNVWLVKDGGGCVHHRYGCRIPCG